MTIMRTRHRFSVDEYEDMIQLGILAENDRVELIRGEVLDKMPIGVQHGGMVNRLNRQFPLLLPGVIQAAIQNPVVLTDSEPEPDVALLTPRNDDYLTVKPHPSDILLLVEVADSSLQYDREVKGPLYADNGIREYWIVDLHDETLEVYRQPQSTGYADVRILRRGDATDLVAFPGVSLLVDDLFR